jgi:hypothetical protein
MERALVPGLAMPTVGCPAPVGIVAVLCSRRDQPSNISPTIPVTLDFLWLQVFGAILHLQENLLSGTFNADTSQEKYKIQRIRCGLVKGQATDYLAPILDCTCILHLCTPATSKQRRSAS